MTTEFIRKMEEQIEEVKKMRNKIILGATGAKCPNCNVEIQVINGSLKCPKCDQSANWVFKDMYTINKVIHSSYFEMDMESCEVRCNECNKEFHVGIVESTLQLVTCPECKKMQKFDVLDRMRLDLYNLKMLNLIGKQNIEIKMSLKEYSK